MRSRLRVTPSSRPRVPLQSPPVGVAATPSPTPRMKQPKRRASLQPLESGATRPLRECTTTRPTDTPLMRRLAQLYAWNRGLHATSISTMVGPWCSLCSQLLIDARLCTSAKSAAVVLLRDGAQCVMLARRNRKSDSNVLPVFLPDACQWLARQPWPSLVVKQVGYYGVQVYLLECYPASTTVPVCEA